jgi:hypothetical protein
MSFDEHVRHAFDTLNDRLREEITRQVRLVTDELVASAEADRQRAVEQTAAEVRSATEATARAREEAEASAAEARRAAEDAAASVRHERLASSQRLLEGVRSLDRARSLSEVLDVLVDAASRDASRAGVLLVRDAGVRGWKFAGFDRPPVARDSDVSMPEGVSALFDLPEGRERTAVPIAIAGETVAFLYADEGIASSDDQRDSGWKTNVEILARHAARVLESITAFKAAEALTKRAGALEPIRSTGGSLRQSDDEEAARRYARLLISEIRMYHEPEVLAGRRDRDLATRLGGEIERARVMYEQRVAPEVRARTDFFHAELVRTLANGDASLLEIKS